jgi:glycosyltransferase involved in cell wall biosynthesis
MKKGRPVVLSVIKLETSKIGGFEMFLREFNSHLDRAGWNSVIYFPCMPSHNVLDYLKAPNLRIEVEVDLFHHSLRCYRKFHRAIAKYKPRIIHAQFADNYPLFPTIARLNQVDQFFVTDHRSREEDYSPQSAPRHRRAITRVLSGSILKRIAVSDYVNHCAQVHGGLPPERHVRIYNGVNMARVQSAESGVAYRRRLGIPLSATVVAQVSQFIPEKGWPDLIRAAEIVLESAPNVHMLFVGDGPTVPEVQLQVATLSSRHRIHFAGLSTDPMGEGIFAATDILCQASCWNEAFGFSIAEGMAHGKPVIATRVGGVPELVDHEQTGLLVGPRDHHGMAKSILRLVEDPQLRARFGSAGRAKARRQFDLKVQIGELMKLYGIKVHKLETRVEHIVEMTRSAHA